MAVEEARARRRAGLPAFLALGLVGSVLLGVVVGAGVGWVVPIGAGADGWQDLVGFVVGLFLAIAVAGLSWVAVLVAAHVRFLPRGVRLRTGLLGAAVVAVVAVLAWGVLTLADADGPLSGAVLGAAAALVVGPSALLRRAARRAGTGAGADVAPR